MKLHKLPRVPDEPIVPQEPTETMRRQSPMVYVLKEENWEYKYLSRPLGGVVLAEDELNALGTEGWELVGTFTDGSLVHFYFKRPMN